MRRPACVFCVVRVVRALRERSELWCSWGGGGGRSLLFAGRGGTRVGPTGTQVVTWTPDCAEEESGTIQVQIAGSPDCIRVRGQQQQPCGGVGLAAGLRSRSSACVPGARRAGSISIGHQSTHHPTAAAHHHHQHQHVSRAAFTRVTCRGAWPASGHSY